MSDYYLIDACSIYIDKKEMHYLAKEGHAVHYTSPTGRKSDYAWHKTTMPELLRLIKAVQLPQNKGIYLKEHHLIASFQELGRVYEYGVKSRHKVAEGVFNYLDFMDNSLGDVAMSMLVDECIQRNFKGMLLMELMDVFMLIQEKLSLSITFRDAREMLCKHFELAGYEVRAGARRPLVAGKKSPALMLAGALPSDIVFVRLVQNTLTQKILNELT